MVYKSTIIGVKLRDRTAAECNFAIIPYGVRASKRRLIAVPVYVMG